MHGLTPIEIAAVAQCDGASHARYIEPRSVGLPGVTVAELRLMEQDMRQFRGASVTRRGVTRAFGLRWLSPRRRVSLA